MSLTELWHNMRDRLAAQQKGNPSNEVLPRRSDSARLRASSPAPGASSLGDATPFANEALGPPVAAIPPPPWETVYPAHHKALVADLLKRGENIANWEIQDGRDLGVSETGHTVAFMLHKTGTSATILVELTLFKGQLSRVRVR